MVSEMNMTVHEILKDLESWGHAIYKDELVNYLKSTFLKKCDCAECEKKDLKSHTQASSPASVFLESNTLTQEGSS